MTEARALQRLLTWLSPAFPVGSFAWSSGLESAIADRHVSDSTGLENWLRGALQHGGLKTDAILLSLAHHAVAEAKSPSIHELAELCLALTASRERLDETTTTGSSFIAAAKAWPSPVFDTLPSPCPYPIAVGAVAAAHEVDRQDTLLAYLTTAIQGQVSVAVRIVPLGQTAGLRTMAALEENVARLAEIADRATVADLGGIAYAADIAQMQHELLQPRLFRS